MSSRTCISLCFCKFCGLEAIHDPLKQYLEWQKDPVDHFVDHPHCNRKPREDKPKFLQERTMSIKEGAKNNPYGNDKACDVRDFHLPYLLDDQLEPNVQDQNICSRF